MPSLDGYSLNQKIDQTHNEVRADILQLQKDFHRLYQMLSDMKNEPKEKNEKASKKSNTKKAVKKEVAEVSE